MNQSMVLMVGLVAAVGLLLCTCRAVKYGQLHVFSINQHGAEMEIIAVKSPEVVVCLIVRRLFL